MVSPVSSSSPTSTHLIENGGSKWANPRRGGFEQLVTNCNECTLIKKISLNSSFYLEEKPFFLLSEVIFQNIPQPPNNLVGVMETAVILRVSSEIFKVHRGVVSRNQTLQLYEDQNILRLDYTKINQFYLRCRK